MSYILCRGEFFRFQIQACRHKQRAGGTFLINAIELFIHCEVQSINRRETAHFCQIELVEISQALPCFAFQKGADFNFEICAFLSVRSAGRKALCGKAHYFCNRLLFRLSKFLLMPKITRSKIAPLQEKITVVLSKDDYQYAFDKQLKKLGKNLELPGFRAGHVPAGLVRKIYGAEVLEETLEDKADDLLEKYLEREQLQIFRTPLLLAGPEDFDLTNNDTFTFEYEIGLHPVFEVVLPDKSVEVTHYNITIPDERINDEVEDALLAQSELAEIPQAETEEDLLYLSGKPQKYADWTLEDLDEEWDFPIIQEFPQRLKDQAIGKRAGDVLYLNPIKDIIDAGTQEYYAHGIAELTEGEEAEDRDYELFVVRVARNVPPAMGKAVFDHRFPEGNIETEEAFREALRQDLVDRLRRTSDLYFEETLLELLLRLNPVEFPVSFLKKSLLDAMEEEEEEQEPTIEMVEARYPELEKKIVEGMLIEKIATHLNFEVSEEDIRAEVRAKIKGYQDVMRVIATEAQVEEMVNSTLEDPRVPEKYLLEAQTRKMREHLQTLVTIREEDIEQEAFFKKYQSGFSEESVVADSEFE